MPYFQKLLFLSFYFLHTNSMMMRNDALISKMVSDFQKDNSIAEVTQRNEPKNVLSILQSVLCKNFPTIPCGMIVEDETLKTLIQRSIQQLKYKKLSMDKTTTAPTYHLTLFPTINSEDLSNFLQVSDTGFYSKSKPVKRGRKHKKRQHKTYDEEFDYKKKSKKESKRNPTVYGSHKNIRKFYPHKIKYKDKTANTYMDYSGEKLSMSVEAPETNSVRKRMSSNNFQAEAPDAVWRIDYTKHGEPSLNVFGYDQDRLKEKLVKTGPNVIVSDNMMEQVSRKDVLHPDVYIKKNFIRKNVLDMNSGGID